MTQHLRWLAVLVGCLLVGDPLFSQGLYGFLKDAPAGRFDKKDWELLKGALRDALEQEEPSSEKVAWTNPENGHHGTITALKAFQSDEGRDCKRVLIESNADGLSSANKFSVCRGEDGVWRELESGAPFTAPPQKG